MGRKRINDEATMARFPGGTLERIEKTLGNKEKTADFIREAIARELAKRERRQTRDERPRRSA